MRCFNVANRKRMRVAVGVTAALLGALAFAPISVFAGPPGACQGLPSQGALHDALAFALSAGSSPPSNGGLGFNMWLTVVNRDGVVCAVVFSGGDRGDQWPGSRVISAQKANTANAFSLPGFALSTANLYSAVQPGGSLYGLQHSNPVDTDAAYGGNSANNGQPNDHMIGKKIGGINVFGGGLGLYDSDGNLLGGLGVSGDTSCTDHFVAWKARDHLGLDFVPAGVATGSTDNIIYDITLNTDGHPVSASGFGHPRCNATDPRAAALQSCYPINATQGPVGGCP